MIANAAVPRLATAAAQALQRRTYFSVSSSLPQVRVSLAVSVSQQQAKESSQTYLPGRDEKTVHGLAIFGGVIAYPIWVIAHVREYKGGN